jgi:xylulokinase
MKWLGIDVGSSSVKCGIVQNGKLRSKVSRAAYPTHYDGPKVEVDAEQILAAIAKAIHEQGSTAKKVDIIGLSVMSPSWLAMDKNGKPLTPVVTHQDRRSVDIARQIEKRIGKQKLLRITGNRPYPGGISSTTFAWYRRHEPQIIKKADLVGHLNTLLHRRMTGARVTDPSNAAFMGLYRSCDLGGWSDELCELIGVPKRLLPDVKFANQIAGRITTEAARHFGLTAGTPMTTGMVDTGAAMMLAGADPGQVLNVSGSTDVLIVCTGKPHPDEHLLTRPLGIPDRWTSVATLAAAGSAITWMQHQFFSEMAPKRFLHLLDQLGKKPLPSSVRFDPYLAGERTSIEQKQASFAGLTLATTREQMLSAVIESLADASKSRIALLRKTGVPMKPRVIVSGGLQAGLEKVLHRGWPEHWRYKLEDEASLRGLSKLHVED